MDKLHNEIINEVTNGKGELQVPIDVVANDVDDPTKDIDENEEIIVDVIVNDEPIDILKTKIDELADKIITVVAEVTGIADVNDLYDAIDRLEDKVVTITTKYVSEGKPHALGGLVSHFADGGSVFKRLSDPFIRFGSGFKDDVAALLMKGEFVHTTQAVQHYGIDFMNAVNSLSFPKPTYFAEGGGVGVSHSNSNSSMPSMLSLSLDFPTSGPPINMQLNEDSMNELLRQVAEADRLES